MERASREKSDGSAIEILQAVILWDLLALLLQCALFRLLLASCGVAGPGVFAPAVYAG